jgi:hypothetical protein
MVWWVKYKSREDKHLLQAEKASWRRWYLSQSDGRGGMSQTLFYLSVGCSTRVFSLDPVILHAHIISFFCSHLLWVLPPLPLRWGPGPHWIRQRLRCYGKCIWCCGPFENNYDSWLADRRGAGDTIFRPTLPPSLTQCKACNRMPEVHSRGEGAPDPQKVLPHS